MPFNHKWEIHAADTDFSGAIYTPAAIDYTIRAFEEMLEEIDQAPHQVYTNQDYTWPTVHAEVDFYSSVGIGDTVSIELSPVVNNSSLSVLAEGYKDTELVFEVKMIHVLTDNENGEAIPIPDEVATDLEKFSPP